LSTSGTPKEIISVGDRNFFLGHVIPKKIKKQDSGVRLAAKQKIKLKKSNFFSLLSVALRDIRDIPSS
jgi:hypothetical protein